jgi:hypothetical protein
MLLGWVHDEARTSKSRGVQLGGGADCRYKPFMKSMEGHQPRCPGSRIRDDSLSRYVVRSARPPTVQCAWRGVQWGTTSPAFSSESTRRFRLPKASLFVTLIAWHTSLYHVQILPVVEASLVAARRGCTYLSLINKHPFSQPSLSDE